MIKSEAVKKEFIEGVHNNRLKEIYIDEALIDAQSKRYQMLIDSYMELYGNKDIEIYSTPGRSEIGGNHTDHQQGMVLAASVSLDAIAAVGYNDDGWIHILSEGYKNISVDLSDLEVSADDEGSAKGLVKGVAKGFLNNGFKIGGFNACITSDVLNGSGLSSSAAFEVMIGTILSGLFNDMSVSPVRIAEIAQFAENVYFKKPCGLMDQMACSVGGLVHIDFKDKMNAAVNQVDVDFKNFHHSLCIIDTKGSHDDLTDEYASIPYEMKKVAGYFGKEVLREVDEDEFFKQLPKLRKELGDRCALRAMHFFEEENRVQLMVKALEDRCFDKFKELIKESGDSSSKYLQNIYTNKDVQSQSMSIALSVSEKLLKGHGAFRVHGGGFAGTILAFVEDGYVSEYKGTMEHVFGKDSCKILKVRPIGGIRVV